jgi:DNA-binding MarR family transcriptional regulator
VDKGDIWNLNDVFTPKARLGIMTILMSSGESDFSTIKEQLGLSDGNLGAHMRVLEEQEYISLEKMFVKRHPKTVYKITEKGQQAFAEHLSRLEAIIRMTNK